jgi:hypothetical protein
MGEGLNAAVRHTQRARRIPDGARCAVCGLADPAALTRSSEQWWCYEHLQEQRGQATTEQHHVLPDQLDPTTVPLPGNMHRVLSELQRELPAEVRKAATHDPLALVITIVGACRDMAAVAVQFLNAALAWLLRLWASLKAHHGPDWQATLGLSGVFPSPAP